ncbi:ATP-binding cassette domain-containing protein [Pseudoalteromonas sp. B193]
MQSSLQIKNCQLYRQNELLLSLNEQVNGGEILTIMGPSGSGKSSLLNWLTGTLPSSFKANGEVWLNGQNIDNTLHTCAILSALSRRFIVFAFNCCR